MSILEFVEHRLKLHCYTAKLQEFSKETKQYI
jgi:hypothetical protein